MGAIFLHFCFLSGLLTRVACGSVVSLSELGAGVLAAGMASALAGGPSAGVGVGISW